MPSTRKV
ncbi:hypothetical protein AVEN_37874-1, partial [Araneus ventricosus]